jgi:hypothetical protein
MSRFKIVVPVILIELLLATPSFGQGKVVTGTSPVAHEIESPAGPQSGEPNLFATSDGRTYLSWIEKISDTRHALRFSIRKGNQWTEPRTIAEGDNWFVNWADFPSLVALSDGSLVAHWLVKAGPGTYAYNINVARSSDGGKTWSKPLIPHRDGRIAEHGFVSLVPLPGGSVGAVWLDGRKFKAEGNAHAGHESLADEMTLRYATINASGQLSAEAEIDARVCECCQTSAAMTSEGVFIVYRDRSAEEVRDISIIRYVNGRWTEPRSINADGWRIEGCPVNGPSVAADGRRVAVAWFTAPGNKPRVNVAFSKDAGASFTQPIQVDEGNPVGRVQVLLLEGGSAMICWLERTSDGGAIKARRVRANGAFDKSITIAETSVARASGFPRMARAGDEIVFAWTDASKPSRVRAAVIRLSDK